MSYITAKHRNLELKYSENDQVWRCDDLNLEAPQLTALKAKMDNVLKPDRTLNIKALMLDTGSYWLRDDGARISEVTVTILLNPRRPDEDPKECWVTDSEKQRHKVYVNSLVPIGDKAKAEEWLRAQLVADEAEKHANKLLEALPRHTAQSLKDENKAKA